MAAYTLMGDPVADAYAARNPEFGFRRLVEMLGAACDAALEAQLRGYDPVKLRLSDLAQARHSAAIDDRSAKDRWDADVQMAPTLGGVGVDGEERGVVAAARR